MQTLYSMLTKEIQIDQDFPVTVKSVLEDRGNKSIYSIHILNGNDLIKKIIISEVRKRFTAKSRSWEESQRRLTDDIACYLYDFIKWNFLSDNLDVTCEPLNRSVARNPVFTLLDIV